MSAVLYQKKSNRLLQKLGFDFNANILTFVGYI
jgi:hypothetical protein